MDAFLGIAKRKPEEEAEPDEKSAPKAAAGSSAPKKAKKARGPLRDVVALVSIPRAGAGGRGASHLSFFSLVTGLGRRR